MRCSDCTSTSRLVQAESVYVRDALAGLLIGGSLGFFLNAYGPIRDGAWKKLAHAVAWGAPAAALGGAIGLVAGELIIGLLRGGLLGRALSWAVLGLGIGLGQGLADRSRDRLIYGLVGGGLGGVLGGFFFEWLGSAVRNRPDASERWASSRPSGSSSWAPAWASAWPWSSRSCVARGFRSRTAARKGGSISWPIRDAVWAWMNAPRSGSSVMLRSHAVMPRSKSTSRGYILHHLAAPGALGSTEHRSRARRSLNDGDRIELGRILLISGSVSPA